MPTWGGGACEAPQPHSVAQLGPRTLRPQAPGGTLVVVHVVASGLALEIHEGRSPQALPGGSKESVK